MDDSKEFKAMLNAAMECQAQDFATFDPTKNVQDQLQEMVERRNTRELLMRFTDWVEKETDYRRESMEQLWLAFVMMKRFGKRWDAEKTEWVKE